MKTINKAFIHVSAAITVKAKSVRYYQYMDRRPQVGDVVYGEICRIGEHSSLENIHGRIHAVHHGSRALFVFGNRYAPDYYEGFVPDAMGHQVDLIARSGVIGYVKQKNAMKKDPTRVKILGYALNKEGNIINTLQTPLVEPKDEVYRKNRAKLILVVGTAMNAGKSMACTACCRALSTMGYTVRAAKVTGTASLKDILHMNDAGAEKFVDFTHLGYPSTYMLSEEELMSIFDKLDRKFANNPSNFWVVEFADGIAQRETAMLLKHPHVQERIHRLIFAAADAFGAIGGLRILKENYNLEPDAISGVCSSSPLHIRELSQFSQIPVFNSASPDCNELAKILI